MNTQAADLGLGSGGFDVVHVNLTRGLDGAGVGGAHVMKLNYTLAPARGGRRSSRRTCALPLGRPVGVLALHGQLAPLAWAAGQARPGLRLGYVQTAGGALPGGHSQVVRELLDRGLLAGHVTAGPAYGGDGRGDHDRGRAPARAAGPRLGRRGLRARARASSARPRRSGHGGLVALDTAHAALALGCPVLICPRMSERRPAARATAASPTTRATVLDAAARAGHRRASRPARTLRDRLARTRSARADADVDGYAASGLPARTMGRGPRRGPALLRRGARAGGVLATMGDTP